MLENALGCDDLLHTHPAGLGAKEITVHCHAECTNLRFNGELVASLLLSGDEVAAAIPSCGSTVVTWTNYDNVKEWDEIDGALAADGEVWHLRYSHGAFEPE